MYFAVMTGWFHAKYAEIPAKNAKPQRLWLKTLCVLLYNLWYICANLREPERGFSR